MSDATARPLTRHEPRARRFGFLECTVSPADNIVLPNLDCPNGHRIPWAFGFHEAGYPRCRHKDKHGREDCRARLFVAFMQLGHRANPPLVFVAEVTEEEIKHLDRSRYRLPEILDFLGVGWAPPRITVAHTDGKP